MKAGEKLVIIGGGGGGFATAMRAKALMPKIDITLVRKEKRFIVRCSLPYVVSGLVTPESVVNPDTKFIESGINVIVGEVTKVDPKQKSVYLSDGRELAYDKLVMATGASPVTPPIEGRDFAGVFTLRSLSDAEKMRAFMEEKKPRKMVFVGAGFITLELAASILGASPGSYDITIVELLDRPLPMMLDPEFSERVRNYLVEKGMKMQMGRKVEKIFGKNGAVCGVLLDNGEQLDADMVLLNVGVRANLELARQIGLVSGNFPIRHLRPGRLRRKKAFYHRKACARRSSRPGHHRGPAYRQETCRLRYTVSGRTRQRGGQTFRQEHCLCRAHGKAGQGRGI